MDKLLGWRWQLGYVMGASVLGWIISIVMFALVYLVLLAFQSLLVVVWRIVSYYQRFSLGSETGIAISIGVVSCVLLAYLLRYSKKLTQK